MNRFLFDTHTLLWYAQGAAALPTSVLQLLRSPDSVCFISRVSLWEITIKYSLGKLHLPLPLADWLKSFRAQPFGFLEITDIHLLQMNALPSVKDHRDPFDRLLSAQAQAENLTLVSRDSKLGSYAVPVLWEKEG